MGCLEIVPLSMEQMSTTIGGGGRLRVVNYHDTDGDGLLDAKSVKIYKDGEEEILEAYRKVCS